MDSICSFEINVSDWNIIVIKTINCVNRNSRLINNFDNYSFIKTIDGFEHDIIPYGICFYLLSHNNLLVKFEIWTFTDSIKRMNFTIFTIDNYITWMCNNLLDW